MSNMLQEQLQKIKDKEFVTGIVGLGYVGLPLMWTFHKQGMPVLGFDIDDEKIRCIKEGEPYIYQAPGREDDAGPGKE